MYSLGVELTEGHISKLDELTDDFLAADGEGREKIVKRCHEAVTDAWPEDTPYNKDIAEAVRPLLATLSCSNEFLACSPVPL